MRTRVSVIVLTATTFSVCACGSSPRGFEVPPGTTVAIEKLDGTTVAGELMGVAGKELRLRTAAGQDVRVSTSDIASLRANLGPSIGSGPPTESPRSGKGSGRKGGRVGAPPAPRASPFKDYQVAAGTRLQIELRTAAGSDTSHAGDQIRGRLRDAVTAEGIELVPAGSNVLGTVTEATPAAADNDRGRLIFRFTVVEHAGTGSRVSIKTAPIVVEATATLKAARAARRNRADPNAPLASEIRLASGANISASLVEPFVVRIPQ